MFIRSKPCSDVVETCGADWSQSGEDLAGQKLVHSQCSNVEGIGGDEDRAKTICSDHPPVLDVAKNRLATYSQIQQVELENEEADGLSEAMNEVMRCQDGMFMQERVKEVSDQLKISLNYFDLI